MKKMQAIWMAAVMMGFVVFSANFALSDTTKEKEVKAENSEMKKDNQAANTDCAPVGQGGAAERRDQAVGNDSPLSKNSQSKEEESAATSPCPPGSQNQSAQPGDAGQESADKGGGSSEAKPNDNAGPNGEVK